MRCRRSVLALLLPESAKRGRSYEADVVKAPMVFSELLIRFLRLADASEERTNSPEAKNSDLSVRSEAWSREKRNKWEGPTKWEANRLCRIRP